MKSRRVLYEQRQNEAGSWNTQEWKNPDPCWSRLSQYPVLELEINEFQGPPGIQMLFIPTLCFSHWDWSLCLPLHCSTPRYLPHPEEIQQMTCKTPILSLQGIKMNQRTPVQTSALHKLSGSHFKLMLLATLLTCQLYSCFGALIFCQRKFLSSPCLDDNKVFLQILLCFVFLENTFTKSFLMKTQYFCNNL